MRLLYLLQRRFKISRFFFPFWSLLLSFILVITAIVIIIIKLTATDYSLDRKINSMSTKMDFPFSDGCSEPDTEQPRAKATLMMLARNSEIKDVVKSVKSLERHFNQWYQYPWTFLNDEPFSEEFKSTVRRLTNAEIKFGVIEPSLWNFPDKVTTTAEFKEGIDQQGDYGVMYGAMESYHKMCRFFSGSFYKHELIKDLDWYWRVEPDVEFFCDLTYDPFIEMEKNGKKYGFNIILQELKETVPNLFRMTKSWMKKEKIKPKSAWDLFVLDYTKGWDYKDQEKFDTDYKNIKDEYSLRSRITELLKIESLLKKLRVYKTEPLLSDESLPDEFLKEVVAKAKDRSRLPTLQGEQIDNEVYNLFHFWSNFEIARVDVWYNEIYESYFQYLENAKGFYKERWGDAPVHSIALGFLLDLDEIHYFRDVGYQHSTIIHCPLNHPNSEDVPYKQSQNYKIKDPKFDKFWAKFDQVSYIEGASIGCRCRCPNNYEDIEDSVSDFYQDWVGLTSDHYNPKNEMRNIAKIEKEVRNDLKKQKVL